MPIPDFQSFFLPLLQFAGDGKLHTFAEAFERLSTVFELTEADRNELLESGRQPRFENRVYWAKIHLSRAGLLDAPERGRFIITAPGRELLKKKLSRLDLKLLGQIPQYAEWRKTAQHSINTEGVVPKVEEQTPQELVELGCKQLRDALSEELLQKMRTCKWEFFEQLVIDVLLRMGYGGTRRDAGEAFKRSGDGGIDGTIKEDKLGLDVVYVQAKKWDANVQRPDVQRFIGSLYEHHAKKGVMIATSSFSSGAIDCAKQVDIKVVLVDGYQLAQLMIDHDVGVSAVATYTVKKMDTDYFEEE